MTSLNIMALRHSAFYSPLLMTMAGGFLKDEGLEHTYTVATPENSVNDGIRAGTVQLAQSAVATSFAALENDEPIDVVHFAQINERDGFFLAAREPQPDFQWKDLIGQKVLVDHFFQPLAMLRYGLHRQGITLDQLHVIDAGNVEQIDQAFRQGQGSYVHQQGPAPQQMEKDGIAYPVAAVGDAIGPVAFSSLCASRAWLETDEARAFMRAYRKARRFVMEAPAEEIAASEAAFFPTIDQQVLAQTIGRYQQLGCWSGDVDINTQAYETLLDVFTFSGAISQRPAMERCVVSPPE